MKRIFIFIAMLLGLSTTGIAQTNSFRIVTSHPDLKIKVQRCEASGSTCIIDLILENIGGSDVTIGFLCKKTVAYDDEANNYEGLVSLNGKPPRNTYYRTLLPVNVPIKARVQIEGLSTAATMFRRIDLNFYCDDWLIGNGDIGWSMMRKYEKFAKLMNVPISREGDE
ncbi:MAG: hypothetical protein J1E33_04650 [Alistipes sp.]|nr:hypothetical protein [Alistipes sp.]